MNKVFHRNKTYFGETTYIVMEDGYGLVMVTRVAGYEKEAAIHDLIVHKDRRGEGIGRALLGEAEEEARRMGAEQVKIVTEPGSWLEEWYKRHGFQIVNLEDNDIIGARKWLIMRKSL